MVPIGVRLGVGKNVLDKGIDGVTVRDCTLEIQVNKRNKKIVGHIVMLSLSFLIPIE